MIQNVYMVVNVSHITGKKKDLSHIFLKKNVLQFFKIL